MTVRGFRLILLVASLLLTQLGGLAHGIGHHPVDQGEPHAACEMCAAYAAFDHGAPSVPLDIPRLACLIPQADTREEGIATRTRLAFRSRAPPLNV